MAILKCKMCGAPLHCSGSATVVECEYCDSRQTISLLDDEKILGLYERANQYRSLNEFDKSSVLYENILLEKPSEAEAHWGICLCRYGIEYVEDPKSHKRIPTCHRTQFKSILEDPNYLAAIQTADQAAREVYSAEANYIDTVQKGILAISSKEEPFDIFICYKESDAQDNRTLDSVLAQDIYSKLTDVGYRVFFARITLEDKLGVAYEPYIFAALSSAKLMLVLGTKPEYFEAVWVKNEWSRYLSFIEQGQDKAIIACFRDMQPKYLPKEFAALQSLDLNKIGAMQDLMRGIEKIIPLKKEPVKETVATPQSATTVTVQSLLKRMFIYLEDGDWTNASKYSERILDIDPENASAYLGKLMIELQVRTEDQLKYCTQPFDSQNYYQKAYRYGDASMKRNLDNAITYIKNRNRIARQESVYTFAIERLRRARSAPLGEKNSPISLNCSNAYDQFKQIQDYKDSQALMEECRELIYSHAAAIQERATDDKTFQQASDLFYGIPDYQTFKDAMVRANECLNRAADLRLERLYQTACESEKKDNTTAMRNAIRDFTEVGNYKDAPQRLQACQAKLAKLEIELKRKLEIQSKKAAKQAKKDRKKQKRGGCGGCLWRIIKFYFIAGIIMAVIAGVVALFTSQNNEPSGILNTLTISADLTECDIGETVVLTVQTGPNNPKYAKTNQDSQEYFSESNIHIYVSENGAVEEIGTGSSQIHTFNSSGEYVFYAKYCPHYTWNCNPAHDIVSNEIVVNVKGNPISSIEELQAIQDSEGDYQLTCDLDFGGMEWTPLNFTGKFSGGGHTISNFTIHSDETNVGFFATLNGDARDVTFQNVTINADGRSESVGILAGTINGSVTNVSVEDCTVNASKGTNVGGIVGLVTELPKFAQFKNLNSCVTVNGMNRVGGIFGTIISSSVNEASVVSIYDCSNQGKIIGTESVGGLFGYIQLDDTGIGYGHNDYTLKMDNLFNSVAVQGTTQVGGIIGYAKTNTYDSYLKNAENSGSINAQAYIGGIAGKLESVILDGCTNNGILNATGSVNENNNNCAYLGGLFGYGSAATNCTNNTIIEYTGNGNYVGGIGGYIGGLPKEIVMENNHNHADISGASYVGGIFGSIYTDSNDDCNLTMQNCSNEGEITGDNYVGGLYGYISLKGNYCTKVMSMTTQSNTGAVTGHHYVGGIVGLGTTQSKDSTLANSTNSSAITAKANVGCIAGWLENITIDSCSNEGSSLTATSYQTADGVHYAHVGGYVGRGYAVNRCTNTVDIQYNRSGRYVGGIAGYITGLASEITMVELKNTADISGTYYVGGIFGELNSTCSWDKFKLTILDFSNEGEITGDDYVGGIMGKLLLDDTRSDSLSDDYYFAVSADALSNSGKVTGTNYVGGILGYGKTDSTASKITDVTATGSVTGKSYTNQINGKIENIIVE